MAKDLKDTHKTGFGFDYRSAIPVIALTITLSTDICIPNSQEAKYRELTNFQSILFFSLTVAVVLLVLALFRENFRKKYSHKGWFVGGFILFFNVLNVVTVKFLLLPQIYFPSLNRVLNVYIEDRLFLLTRLPY